MAVRASGGDVEKGNNNSMLKIFPNRNMLFGIREKLIAIFVIIKVLPLIVLAIFAARQIDQLGQTVKDKSEEMVTETRDLVTEIGALASESSIKALDLKSREAIERLTTDTALVVADFLYARDTDVLLAAELPIVNAAYEQFLSIRKKSVIYHDEWVLNEDGTRWLPPEQAEQSAPYVRVKTTDNKKDFHYRQPRTFPVTVVQPLYHELTFVDLKGQERVKIAATEVLGKELRDVSKKENTWCRAETYFTELEKLQQGEVYVSRVIGPYIPSPVIGPFTPDRARQANIPFEPQNAGYAGKENPVGKRFQGLIRWGTPVYRNGVRLGYVTLALDHTHLMEFTDHIVPTEERMSDISDAGSGNYAFMWDVEGRNISHPRDYFIVGYDPQTGDQAVPWLSSELYDLWLAMDKSFSRFEDVAPRFQGQSLEKKPAVPLIKAGMLGLDCRYLNFAPQCSGWENLTQYGGSGSFVIFWSKLWKLTTAAAIPYYTGMYSQNPRGFGFVTIGANVDEFHSSATETATSLNNMTKAYESGIEKRQKDTLSLIDHLLTRTIENLTLSTAVMVVIVILIAFWMASTLTGKITSMIEGIKNFQLGNLSSRLTVESNDELGQLTTAFNDMANTVQVSMEDILEARERAEESDKAKSLFLANMSHEIRTPMNAIIGMSRLALAASENEEQTKLLDSVKTSADSLLAVINDILDFSKIEAGQLSLENYTFSLHRLVQSTVKSVAVLAEDKDIEVGYGIAEKVPKIVRGDNMRLRQILLNLLGNAVKFTKRGIVSLEVRSNNRQDDKIEVVFTVRDTGIGIASQHLEMIFDRFSQSDESIARKHQGAGLGLAISRKLCHLMGGDISVESELGMGSTFTFSVLFEDPGPDLCADEQGTVLELKDDSLPLKVLLVEDNKPNRDLARMVLEQDGHTVATAESGMDALQLLADDDFNVVLMDIQMPEMDGFTATETIRCCEAGRPLSLVLPESLEKRLRGRIYGRHQPVVALTAHAMSGDKERCLAGGMDDYLTKPFLPEQVVATLRRHAGLPVSKPTEPDAAGNVDEQVTDQVSLYDQARQNLADAYGLDSVKIENLLTTTVGTIREDIASLRQAVDRQESEKIHQIAHSLKGILLNLRLTDLAALAAQLQENCDEGDDVTAGAAALIDGLQEFVV